RRCRYRPARRSMPSRARASCSARSIPAWRAFPWPTAKASGRGSTSISARRSPQPCSAMPRSRSSRRPRRSSASSPCSRARSTSSRATPRRPCCATPRSASTSPASISMTARGNIKSAKELNGATVCVQPGTTTELNLADYFRKQKMTFKPVLIEKLDELLQAYAAGRCDAYTTDASGLAAVRVAQLAGKGEHVILPERISKEPLGPIVRHGDDQWFDLVKWVLVGMIEAEEMGITSKNVDELLKSDDPAIKRFLGVTPSFGKAVGVDEKWMYNVIKQVGNYGESYERNVGTSPPLKLERGQNALWTNGGLLYAIPFRWAVRSNRILLMRPVGPS